MSRVAQPAPVADDHAARVHPSAKPSFGHSLEHSWHGVRHVIRHERNARIHLLMAVLVVVAAAVWRVSVDQWVAVLFAIMLVFLAEVFNTAIERTLDLIDIRENAQIKIIKDMTAGAVLLAAVAAVLVGALVFGPPVLRWFGGLG